jgi:alkylation response protein AidB-like acyl-CoA dehydrogenase
MFISNGIRAHTILLLTRTGPEDGHHGFTLFLVDMGLPGVIRERKLDKMGMNSSDTGLLAFQDVRVPASAAIGEIGSGFFHIMAELQAERLVMAAGGVAAAQAMFDKTLQYAGERTAFGRQIGHFQAIRHKFAQMATDLEAARQLTYATARSYAAGEYPVREISMAKLFVSQIAWKVADECLQIHGGAGVMREYGIERAWRDARIMRIGGGTDEIVLDLIGRTYGL